MTGHPFKPSWVRPAVLAGLLLAAVPATGRADTFVDVQKQIQQASDAFQKNDQDQALHHLGKALDLIKSYKPDVSDYIRTAYLWINRRKAGPARQAVDSALALNPEAAEAHYQLGYLEKGLGNTDKALESLKKALELKAASARGLKKASAKPVDPYWAGSAAAELWNLFDLDVRDYDLAARTFQALADQEPDNVDYLYYLGIAHSRRASLDQAADAWAKGLDLRPDDWRLHVNYLAALKRFRGTKEAVRRYEEFLKRHPVLAAQVALGKLYVEGGQKEKAVTLLRRAKRQKALLDPKNSTNLHILSIRIQLAKAFSEAEQHADAADQFARILAALPGSWSMAERISFRLDYGKSLVKASRAKEGLVELQRALADHRARFPNNAQLLELLFGLGKAYRDLGRKDQAEIYFRQYLEELRAGTVGTQRFASDVEIAEGLGDLYDEDGEHKKAAEVFKEALATIDVAVDKDKCPAARVRFKYVQALHGQKAWDKCIPAAQGLLGDKEYGNKTRKMLARAYLETGRRDDAITQLSQLKGTPEWDDVAVLLMGQTLLKDGRAEDALGYLKEAYQKQPDDDKRALKYAEVLGTLNRTDEARALYEKIRKDHPRNSDAWVGLGELEMVLAKNLPGGERREHLARAVKDFTEARNLAPSAAVLTRLGQAERELALADAEIQARSDRWRLVLYAGGLLLAALIPVALFWVVYRRQWLMRCFREVLELERDLTQIIRDRVLTRWDGDWQRLADEPFRGRVDYRSLRGRAEREGARDVLGVANFGHLVGIVDAGWDVLGFCELCAPEMVDPKEVILANLSYVGSCRTCLAHVGKLEELTARHLGAGRLGGGTLKAHLSQHLHRQVRTSLKIIRAKFNLTPGPAAELPVLAPLPGGSDAVRAGRAPGS
jgi:tetratricopeptide (TPR) repeat protein